VDDLLATGGTVGAMIKMVEKMQGIVVGCAFVIELDDLHGRDRLGNVEICALTHYKGE
jgi:adenine phosphoribosyltransferase